MATEKNITMKQFNGTDYDTLYPKTIASQIPDVYSKTDTITAETLTQLGLTADKLPNDAFQQIKTLIDNVQSSTDSKAKIQTGSYVGTGTYGANNPCSLTFDFEPKVVFIEKYKYYDTPFYASGAAATFRDFNILINPCVGGNGTNASCHIAWNSNTVSWYFDYTPVGERYMNSFQQNVNGQTYHYIGIG